MKKRRIVSDSSCDMLEIAGLDFTSVPISIATEQKTYLDDGTLDVKAMLDELAVYQGRSYTACPNVARWLESFEGADELFVVTISSGVSGSYQAAMAAKEVYLQIHPDVKIDVLDSLSAGPVQRMHVERLAKLVRSERSFEQIVQEIHAYAKRTQILFCLESMHNFAQNGRISKFVASAAGVLGIRILGTTNEVGALKPLAKCRGQKRTLAAILEQLRAVGYQGGELFIGHVENLGFAEEVRQMVQRHYATAKVFVYKLRGLCSYYAERGGVLVGCECAMA